MAGKKKNANTAIGYQMARMMEERRAQHLITFVCVVSKHSTMIHFPGYLVPHPKAGQQSLMVATWLPTASMGLTG